MVTPRPRRSEGPVVFRVMTVPRDPVHAQGFGHDAAYLAIVAQNFHAGKGFILDALWLVCLPPARLALAKTRYPAIAANPGHSELMEDPRVDVVVISTPVHTHLRLAMQALQAGKHAVIEKPITASSEEALRLIEAAQARRLQILVDHTFICTGAVRKIKELADSGSPGKIQYYDSVGVNLGLFQPDVNVIWDLAVHDLSIMDYVLSARPAAVPATGLAHVEGRPENIVYITMFFEQPLIAHIHVNWLSPVKVRP